MARRFNMNCTQDVLFLFYMHELAAAGKEEEVERDAGAWFAGEPHIGFDWAVADAADAGLPIPLDIVEASFDYLDEDLGWGLEAYPRLKAMASAPVGRGYEEGYANGWVLYVKKLLSGTDANGLDTNDTSSGPLPAYVRNMIRWRHNPYVDWL